MNDTYFSSQTYKLLAQQNMSPTVAASMLNNQNHDNPRDLDEHEARRIAKDIKKHGCLRKVGAPIVILKDGTIKDGQTRLRAIHLAGITVKIDIAVGVDPKDASYVGTSRRFHWGVVLSNAKGYGKAKASHCKNAHAIVLMWLRFLANWKNVPFSIEERVSFFSKHEKTINLFLGDTGNPNADRCGVRTALAYYYSFNPDMALDLWKQISGEVEDVKLSSVITLRERLVKSKLGYHAERRKLEDFKATLALCEAVEKGSKYNALSIADKVW